MEYFVARGSTVFMAALDARKAFDRVNHVKLFSRMCEIGVRVLLNVGFGKVECYHLFCLMCILMFW